METERKLFIDHYCTVIYCIARNLAVWQSGLADAKYIPPIILTCICTYMYMYGDAELNCQINILASACSCFMVSKVHHSI